MNRLAEREDGVLEPPLGEERRAANEVGFRQLRIALQGLVGRVQRLLQHLGQTEEVALDLIRRAETGPGLGVIVVDRQRALEEVNRAIRCITRGHS